MEISNETFCTELLLTLICHDRLRGCLSSEMEYLFEKHLENCPNCRQKIFGFHRLLHRAEHAQMLG
jgi:hypothetical protein